MKTAIVTGAGRGIGKEVSLGLAKAGYRVVMGVRDRAKAAPVRDELARLSGNPEIELAELDVSSLASVRAFAQGFLARQGSLEVLVNNAGITSRERRLSADGHELVVATNYLGPFLLTELLMPALEASGQGRVVNLTSNIHGWWGYRFEGLDGYAWVKAYAVSKLLVLEASLELARELGDRPVSVNAVHPGIVRTTIMYTGHWYDVFIKVLLRPFFIGVEEGAAPILGLALEEGPGRPTGRYFDRFRAARPSWRVGREARRSGRSVLEATRGLLGRDLLEAGT